MKATIVVAATAAVHVSAGQYSFIDFEETIFPKWIQRFSRSDAPADFSYLPVKQGQPKPDATLYGVADAIHAKFSLRQLDDSDSQAFIDQVDSFQNESTGFYNLKSYEHCGFNPWHSGAYGAAAIKLVKGSGPKYPYKWALDIANNASSWVPTFAPLLDPTDRTIWSSGHKIAGIPAALVMFNTTPSEGHPEFINWWVQFMDNNTDMARSGFICKNKKWEPPDLNCLGGFFHLEMIYNWLKTSWRAPELTYKSAAGMQHSDGTWSGGDLSYIDIDGLFTVTRSAQLNGQPSSQWQHAEAACDEYLKHTSQVLADESTVIDGYLGTNTHTLPGVIGACAECMKWFPHLAVTKQPWRMPVDYACFI